MNYTVYCDESRHSGGIGCQFAVIGGLWIQREFRDAISKDLSALKKKAGVGAELKWSRVSLKKLVAYKEISDYFWNNQHINYRAIIVDQISVDYSKFHDGDKELGFYKFYYEMLEKWLHTDNDYNILLDFKNNSDLKRLPKLYSVLRNFGQPRAISISNLTSIDSSQSNIAQLCDILTGAVAADANGTEVGTPKADMIRHLVQSRNVSPLSAPSRSPAFSKFNIFRIALGGHRLDR